MPLLSIVAKNPRKYASDACDKVANPKKGLYPLAAAITLVATVAPLEFNGAWSGSHSPKGIM